MKTITLILLNMFDYISTLILTADCCEEANPLGVLILSGGWLGALYKLVILSFVIVLIGKLAKRYRIANIGLNVCVVSYGLLATCHLASLCLLALI